MKSLLAVLFSLALFASASAAPLHHYDFNDDSAVLDSVGTDDGALVNGASLTAVPGQLSLDGVDDLVQFSAKLIPSSGDFSLTFFAQETSDPGYYAELISQGFSGGPGFYVGHNPSHDFRIGDNWISTGIPFPSDGLMHHFALVSDPTDISLYIDGAFVGSKGSPFSLTSGGDDTRLGSQFSPFAENFPGRIDELWVFDNALSAEEVASFATLPEPGSLALALVGTALAGITLRRRARVNAVRGES